MKIERQTLAQQVLDRLIVRLSEKNYHPGDKLATEQELMEEFVVSRSSVREAIKALQNLGILESKPARGTFISAQKDTYARLLIFAALLSEDSRKDLAEFQIALEAGALLGLQQEIKAATSSASKKRLQACIKNLQEALSYARKVNSSADLINAAFDAHITVIGDVDSSLNNKVAVSLLEFQRREFWSIMSTPQLIELFKSYLGVLKTLLKGEEKEFFTQLDLYCDQTSLISSMLNSLNAA